MCELILYSPEKTQKKTDTQTEKTKKCKIPLYPIYIYHFISNHIYISFISLFVLYDSV